MSVREISGSSWCRRTAHGLLLGAALVLGLAAANGPANAATSKDYGKPGEPIELVVGYQPYYTESWSGVIMRDKNSTRNICRRARRSSSRSACKAPSSSTACSPARSISAMSATCRGSCSTSHSEVRDIRIVSSVGLGFDQCNTFLVRTDAPEFKSPEDAIKWLQGKTVAVPKGSCTDRFAQAVFKRFSIEPSEYLNQSIEVITSGFRAKKLDAAVIWEPTASRLVHEVSPARSRPGPRSTRTMPASWSCRRR